MSSSSEMKNALENFLIPLEDIRLATNYFDKKNQIGDGGFGSVYKGQLSERWGNRTAAIKRRDLNGYQGKHEFETELQMVSKFDHPNIISFIGYCDEGEEMIIVYEYAINGSLDNHLSDHNRRGRLTWARRLNICLGAARGLGHLHSGLGDDHGIIHRDVKSSNILLDRNLEAKISDFGFSRTGAGNNANTQVHTGVAGTSFYIDPIYRESGRLTKKSDVYSLGVVLFEMLSGMLVFNRSIEGDTLLNLVRKKGGDGVDKIIDPHIRDQFNSESLKTFQTIAYKCICFNLKQRPTMDSVIKEIEKAVKFELAKYLIPLEEINLGTNNFSEENYLGGGGFGKVYRGTLSESRPIRTAAIKRLNPRPSQGKHEFMNKVLLLSSCHHQNIIAFIGYCDEDDEMIMAFEYANKSLDQYLRESNKMCDITWSQRLKMCIGSARGLNQLHWGLCPNHRRIHGDVNSANILLDDKGVAKISEFKLSEFSPKDQPRYHASNILTKESEVYSFGVVLFEVLCGRHVFSASFKEDENDDSQTLVHLIRCHKDNLYTITDPHVRDHINSKSLDIFTGIACKCLESEYKKRPTMTVILEMLEDALSIQYSSEVRLEKFKIPLEEIRLATNNFSQENYLGGGAFGKVYRGTLSESRPIRTAAIKRLNPSKGQGKWKFMNKVFLLSSCHHQNIIAFIGYCDEGDEMIMAFEYANKSLGQYLRDSNKMRGINWLQRLNMCIGSARGLNQLHWGLCPNHRRIHGVVNSANILLADKWVTKISELRLSKFSPKDQLNTMAAGTNFYCDPNYYASNILTKESDVYSFGVILIEVLCGRLVFPKTFKEDDDNDDSWNLLELIRRHKDNLHMIIDPHIRDDIGSKCLDLFMGIASKCLEHDYKKRPTMSIILEKLEEALSIEVKELPCNYKEIIRRSDQPYTNKRQLYSLLAAGILIDGGKKKFFVSKMNKKNSLVISAKELFDENDEHLIGWESFPNLRFSHVAHFKNVDSKFVHKKAMQVTATMLSLESTYAVFLICKYTGKEHKAHTKSSPPDICFKLLYGENKISLSSADWKDEEWMEVELFMFTNHMEVANFEIHLKWKCYGDCGLYVEGIEFRPIEMATIENDETKVEQLSELESDTDWERKLASDYEEVISRSTEVLEFSTKEELYLLLSRGILIDDNSMWFWLDKSNGKKCVLLSAKHMMVNHINGVSIELSPQPTISRQSRFPPLLMVNNFSSAEIGCKIKAQMLSPKTPYAAWLVYDEYSCSGLHIASLTLGNQEKKTRRVYLDHSSKTIRPMNDPKYQDKYIGTSSVKLDRRCSERDDGWREVELFPFFNDMDAHDEVEVGVHINATSGYNYIYLEGIEFRPQ